MNDEQNAILKELIYKEWSTIDLANAMENSRVYMNILIKDI